MDKSYKLISSLQVNHRNYSVAGNINASSIDPIDIENHAKHAKDWWNVNGLLKPLHSMNTIR